jgi:copper chaperone CopZ
MENFWMRKSVQSERHSTRRLLAGSLLVGLLTIFGSMQFALAASDAATSKPSPAGSTGAAPAAGSQTEEIPMMLPRGQIKEERKKKLNMAELRRLDWRVTGSSCAACLGRIRKRVDKEKGVFEVAVAIKKPYGVAVIYDGTKTNKDKLLEAAKKDEKLEIMFHDMVDEKIDNPPLILVPKYNSLVK